MRELKFRVWSDFWEKYADFGAELSMDGSVDAYVDDDNGIPHHESTDLIIEQYTGLKDKNGKEIYEGDIVSTSSVGTWQIEERRGCFWVGKYALYGQNDYCEVIGNIHENPELIEKEK